jgi:non-canonical (house-cleaning) NTP pyrophosphatase
MVSWARCCVYETGLNLSDAADLFFKTHGTGVGSGVIGHLTDGLIDRTEYYIPAAIIALAQVKNNQWFV